MSPRPVSAARRARAWPWVAMVLVLAAAWLWHARASTAGTRTTDPRRVAVVTAVYGGAATADQIEAALRAVRVVAARPHTAGYERDCGSAGSCVFGEAWSDDTQAPDAHNGCDTRDDVMREQLVAVRTDADGCRPVSGTMVDPYTGRLVDYAAEHHDIEIDHVVPLAYAWDMGASTWSQTRRDAFANDTTVELLASWGPANQAKGDAGPADWLPPDTTFRCDYVLRFLTIAARYDLAITSADAAAGRDSERYCD